MPNIKVEPTIPNYPPQGIQAQLDLLYLWNPDVANNLIDQINKALEDLDNSLSIYLTKDEAAATYATQEDLESGLAGKQDLLTAEQLAAVNSGITAEHVTTYDSYAADISQAQNDATKAENAAEVAQQTANLAGQEAAQALTQLAGKVNINQGADNAGKVMSVGADGNLAPADAPSSSLPDQTGNAGKFLTTDGTSASWEEALVNNATISRALAIGTNTATGYSAISIGNAGYGGKASGLSSIVIGSGNVTAAGAIQIGDYTTGGHPTNSEEYSVYFALKGTNYKLFGEDGIIPTERLATGGAAGQVYTKTESGAAWQSMDVYSKEETDQQIQNAIGTIETALAEV